MPSLQLHWIGQEATARSSRVDSLHLLNGYAEVVESHQGKAVTDVYGTPGLRLWATMPMPGGIAVGIRGMFQTATQRLFVVAGNTLYELWGDGSAHAGGTLGTATGPVGMTENGLALCLVDGEHFYTLTYSTAVFATSADPNWQGSYTTDFLDGYVLFVRPGTAQFYWTQVLSTTIEPLGIATAEGSPDLLVSLRVAHREVLLFGTFTTELWTTTGQAGANAFARIPGAVLEWGCLAPFSPALVGETVCWLGRTRTGEGMVLAYDGGHVTQISTAAFEAATADYPFRTDAIGWAELRDRHAFYWLTFPSGNATWVYDLSTGLWHQRGSLDPATGMVGRHRANALTVRTDLGYLCGDYALARLYVLDPATYTDAGVPIPFAMTMPPLFDGGGRRVRQSRFHLDIEAGVGLDGGVVPGTDPMFYLELSDDGGATWGPAQPASMGPIGARWVRLLWHRLGAFYDRRCRVRTTAPVKRVIVTADTTLDVLAS